MRILILAQEISLDRPGGSGKVAWEQARSLVRAGYTVALGVPRAGGELPERETRDGVTIFRYGNVKFRSRMGRSIADIIYTPRFVKSVLDGSSAWNALIVHHPHVGYGALRVRAARLLPFLYVFHASAAAEIAYEGLSRPGLPSWVGWFIKPLFVSWTRLVERRVLRCADVIGVFSDFSGDLLKRLYRRAIQNKRVAHLPMGVDMERFTLPESRADVRARLKLPERALIFLTVRRLVPRTGVRILIDAMRVVYDRLGGGAVLCVLGEGREAKELRGYAKAIGMGRAVQFAGHVPEEQLPLWYQAADVCVIPTVAYEGFGVSIIEAMASGVPVIGTSVGAIPEILGSFDERLLANAARPMALADRLVWFAEEGVREDWGERTRDFVKRYYSWEKHARTVEALLKKIQRRSRKARGGI